MQSVMCNILLMFVRLSLLRAGMIINSFCRSLPFYQYNSLSYIMGYTKYLFVKPAQYDILYDYITFLVVLKIAPLRITGRVCLYYNRESLFSFHRCYSVIAPFRKHFTHWHECFVSIRRPCCKPVHITIIHAKSSRY